MNKISFIPNYGFFAKNYWLRICYLKEITEVHYPLLKVVKVGKNNFQLKYRMVAIFVHRCIVCGLQSQSKFHFTCSPWIASRRKSKAALNSWRRKLGKIYANTTKSQNQIFWFRQSFMLLAELQQWHYNSDTDCSSCSLFHFTNKTKFSSSQKQTWQAHFKRTVQTENFTSSSASKACHS